MSQVLHFSPRLNAALYGSGVVQFCLFKVSDHRVLGRTRVTVILLELLHQEETENISLRNTLQVFFAQGYNFI